ncbi:hypothetical protein, partial [Idiomarina zobellii]
YHFRGTHDIIGLGKIFERKPLKHLQDGIVTHQGNEIFPTFQLFLLVSLHLLLKTDFAGMAKGVRIIENNNKPIPALVLDG